ncbi:MAG: 50S ribosome-binding GTPase, partial [Clostridia bacterium]|nr:50S ribosome-binding GTPase [Clostridia bacterium]
MSLNETVSAERIHIGFFGMRNAGKSSLVNAVTGVNVSVVSDVKGTTTDPVRKAMELLPLGPVLIIDTPGIDDEGELGEMRVQRAKKALSETDIAVLVVDGAVGITAELNSLIGEFMKRGTPYVTVYNKADLIPEEQRKDGVLYASAKLGDGIAEIKAALGEFASKIKRVRPIISDIISHGD